MVVARSALRLRSNAISLRCRALIIQRELCDWRGLSENIEAIQLNYLSAVHLNAPCLTPFDALGLVAIDSKSQGISPSDLQKISAYFSNQRLFLVKNSRPAPLVPPPPPSFKISTLNLGIASSLLQDNKIARYLQPALRFWNSSPLDLAIQVFCFGLRLQAGLSHTTGREELASACVTCFPRLHNFNTEWRDEKGRLWPKDVTFHLQRLLPLPLLPLPRPRHLPPLYQCHVATQVQRFKCCCGP